MYGFVDTLATEDAKSISMSIQTIFNGINLDEELTDDQGSFTTLTVSGRREQKQKISTIPVPGLDGVIEEQEPTIEPLEPEVKFRLRDDTNEGFGERLIRLRSLLSGSKKKLKFTDEEVFLHATVDFLEVPEEESNDLICYIRFFCSDPYLYGPEQPYKLEDISTIENKGTAPADPIFELTAKKKATFAMVSLGADEDSEYNLIGTPADDDVEVVDARKTVYSLDGMEGWSSDGVKNDSRFPDVVGTMQYDGTGMRPNLYGSGDKIHGPGVFRELPETVQDFEINTIFDVISDRDADNFRLQVDFFDENMNNIGMLGVKDNNRYKKLRIGMARFGRYRGGGRSNGYLIGEDNYTHEFGNNASLHLSFKRVGDLIEVKVGRWYARRLIETLKETYHDVSNEYQGRLKYIQVLIGSFGDRAKPARLRINKIEVVKLSETTVDQTPYIVYPGDKVVFDHKNDEILINGELRPDLITIGAFGSSFFKLPKGFSNVIVTPSDTFDTTVKFRDKFR